MVQKNQPWTNWIQTVFFSTKPHLLILMMCPSSILSFSIRRRASRAQIDRPRMFSCKKNTKVKMEILCERKRKLKKHLRQSFLSTCQYVPSADPPDGPGRRCWPARPHAWTSPRSSWTAAVFPPPWSSPPWKGPLYPDHRSLFSPTPTKK